MDSYLGPPGSHGRSARAPRRAHGRVPALACAQPPRRCCCCLLHHRHATLRVQRKLSLLAGGAARKRTTATRTRACRWPRWHRCRGAGPESPDGRVPWGGGAQAAAAGARLGAHTLAPRQPWQPERAHHNLTATSPFAFVPGRAVVSVGCSGSKKVHAWRRQTLNLQNQFCDRYFSSRHGRTIDLAAKQRRHLGN